MNKWAGLAVLVAVLAGCAPQSTVVLVADADGHVGRVALSTPAGTVLLDQPQSASSAVADGVPSAPKTLNAQQIEQSWGDALTAMPARPLTFQLYFETGTAELQPQSRALILDAVAAAKRRPHVFVMIAGHADAVGSDDVNDRISRRRAEVVHQLMLELGVPDQAIRTSSHGKRNPLVPTPDGMAEPRNRRVTLTLQ